jgi:hypothetical protein
MSYRIWNGDVSFGPREGLDGPYVYPNGRVLYYDVREGDYWDPLTDFFVDRDEVGLLQKSIFDIISE